MRIEYLYRYPVKGLTAEALEQAEVETGGSIPWDRAFALAQGDAGFDPANAAWLPKWNFLCLMKNARAALLFSTFDPRSKVLRIRAPDGSGIEANAMTASGQERIASFLTDYLGEEALIKNVDTHICGEASGLQYTMDNLDKLVTKPVGESGGYGITIGPRASKEELEASRAAIMAAPSNWISQPMISLSVAPTLTDAGLRPRHLDLRPFAITGRDTWVLPGGLSRVALKEGSLIVNSSQGGGSKDTWVLAE